MSELALLHAGVIAAPLASNVSVQRSLWVADACLEIANAELARVKDYYAQQQREVHLTRTLTDMLQVIPLLSIPNGDFSTIPGKGFCGWLVMLKLLHPALSLDLLEDGTYKSLCDIVQIAKDKVPATYGPLHLLIDATLMRLGLERTSARRDYAHDLYLPQDFLLVLAGVFGFSLFLFIPSSNHTSSTEFRLSSWTFPYSPPQDINCDLTTSAFPFRKIHHIYSGNVVLLRGQHYFMSSCSLREPPPWKRVLRAALPLLSATHLPPPPLHYLQVLNI
jgi:hypothetical protein